MPLVVCGIVAAASPRLVKGWRPAWAARTLAFSALLLSLAAVWGLMLLAGILVGQAPAFARPGDYSRIALGRLDPVPQLASVAAIIVLVVAVWRIVALLAAALKRRRLLLDLLAAGSGRSELQVILDDRPFAAAVAPRFRRPGRVLVSVGMLRSLDGAERRALLAHERAHLRRRHNLYEGIGRLAAAMNPMLAGLLRALRFALERWADEDAAASVLDRELVARAIGKAALASLTAARPPGAVAAAGLGFERLGVIDRIQALSLEPTTSRRLPVLAATAVITLVAVWAALDATVGFFHLLLWAGAGR